MKTKKDFCIKQIYRGRVGFDKQIQGAFKDYSRTKTKIFKEL